MRSTECSKCGARLPDNSERCNSCGQDPAASPGAPPAESLEERLARLEAGASEPKQSVAAKVKKALGVK